jgi:hypothetical protein
MKKILAIVSLVLGLSGVLAAVAPSASAADCTVASVWLTVTGLIPKTHICV